MSAAGFLPRKREPDMVRLCLLAAQNFAEERDWENLAFVAEGLAQQARLRALEARGDEAGVIRADRRES